jgi:hypothetical protein
MPQKNISKPIRNFKLGFSVQNCGDLPTPTQFSAGLHPQILRNSPTLKRHDLLAEGQNAFSISF